MDSAQEYAPERSEVETQLDRMVVSEEFASSERQSEILRYIVVNSLPDKEGKTDPSKLTEDQIGLAVFKEDYDLTRNPNIVRVHGTHLRKRIRRYYANSGTGDLVAIDVPPGGYRAVFSYNGRSPAGKLYRRACSLIGALVPSEHEHKSLALLREAITADSGYAPAHAALAEAELREAIYRRSIPPHNPLAAAEASGLEAVRLQPKLWRAHAVLGVTHCCRREWREAEKSFAKAIALAPNARRDHPWYTGFLLAAGGRREELEALRLARARVEAKPEDASARIALGFFLYLARQFDEAVEVLQETEERFPTNFLASIVLACVQLALGDPEEAMLSTMRAHRIQDEQVERGSFRDNVFPGLYHLCALRIYAGDDRLRFCESLEKAVKLDCTASHAQRHLTGEVNLGVLWDGWDSGEFDTYIPYWTPLQLALGLMGFGDKEAGIAALTRAVNEGDPLTVFLRRLPLFDELRSDAAFTSLVQRMNFPSKVLI